MGNCCVSKPVEPDDTTMGNKSAKEPTSYDVSNPGANAERPKDKEPIADPVDKKSKPVQQVICNADDLNDGEMKDIEVNGQKILLARDQGTFYAVSAKCTHYGAPLSKGALCKGRVRCPWHGACFDLATGDIEDFPGLDSLQTFDIEVHDGKVSIDTDTVQLASTKRVKKMITRNLECTLLYLIVGGGPAAMEAAETMRQYGYIGKILIMTMENDPPYDRTKLSKAMTSKGSELALRPEEFYSVYDISIMTGMEAWKVDTEMNHMVFKGGEYTDYTVEYDQAVICTGSRPTRLAVRGAPTFKKDVYYLRTPEDANNIATRANDANVVIVGTSFIGMEVAAYLVGKARSVTVVGRSKLPFLKSFGEKISTILYDLFVSKGVKFQMETGVQELTGNEESLTQVILNNGESLRADICVVGIGVQPNTDWLVRSTIKLTPEGHIKVSKYNKTNIDNVFAAGDCTNFPLFMNYWEPTNIGHFQMAMAHGKGAAMAMCSKEEELISVPFFWTSLFGKSIRYCGYGNGNDEAIFHGDESKFIAFFVREEKIVGVASLNWDPLVSVAAELMRASIPIPPAMVKEDPESLRTLVPK